MVETIRKGGSEREWRVKRDLQTMKRNRRRRGEDKEGTGKKKKERRGEETEERRRDSKQAIKPLLAQEPAPHPDRK